MKVGDSMPEILGRSGPGVCGMLWIFTACMDTSKPSPPRLPEALRCDTVFQEFGVQRPDPYYRLRERNHPEVIRHLENENNYTKAVMAPYKELTQAVLEELVARIPPEDEGYPYFYKGWFYGFYYESHREYPVHYRSRTQEAEIKEVLLDENVVAQGASYCDVGDLDLNPAGNILAYTVDFSGNRRYAVWIKDLSSGSTHEEITAVTDGSVVWSADGKYLFYTEKDPVTLRPYKVFRHRLGSPKEQDELLFTETDETFYCHLSKTSDEKFILIESHSTESTEILFAPAEGPFRFLPLIPRQRGHLYDADFHDSRWILRTNYKAPNYRLMALPPGAQFPDQASEIIPEQDYLIEDFDLTRHWLAWEGISNGDSHVYYTAWHDFQPRRMDFGPQPQSVVLADNNDYSLPYVRVLYNDLKTLPTLYDVVPGENPVFRFRKKINFAFDPDMYETARVMVPARDGEEVPVSLVWRKDRFREGQNPLLLYGYGSYGISLTPYFSSARLSLLDRGFVFALAHVRGGQDRGRPWYDAGRLLNKKNTFYDFIDCAEGLIQRKWCAPRQVMAMGGSAGGLLMGAVLNMRPDVWAAIVAQVPFVDVLTTMLDPSIPLTTGEYDEWGNPHVEKFYHYIRSYSPYDNVPRAAFPPVLVTTGLHDSQVQYWEPAKWVLRLRDNNTGPHPILLYCEMEAGHGGRSGRYGPLEEVAREYSFLLHYAGITK
ncbi:MAG: S9 family peptidase [Flavobacteriales bacterium]|nr:S9 family peptidase [Flavobacteriales bacterium]